ncbi:MAG: hypothetical protein ACJAYH_000449 [Celeribacter sp.]|jgi:uncharacterized protein involved in response to NO
MDCGGLKMRKTTSEQCRAWQGPAVFSYGFRPFFLFGAVWAAVAMVMWIFMLSTGFVLPTHLEPVSWHAHEFLFGSLGAIIAGFLLTAVPNWTGRLPVVGWGLAALFALWLAGRFAMATSALWPNVSAQLVDLSFPVVLGAVLLREIIAGRNWRNLVILILLAIFTLANLLFHLDAAGGNIAAQGIGMRVGMSALIMMMCVIGGRVVPSFTRNWLVQQGATRLPVPPMQRFDKAVLLITVIALLLWVIAPSAVASGVALLMIGMLHFVRLGRWEGVQTLAQPLLWILHVGYAFVPLGAVMIAGSILYPDVFSGAAAQHLWMAGAFGVMSMAMMSRATLGHTGQKLHAGRGTVVLFVSLITSVFTRLAAAFWPDAAMIFYAVSGVLWVGAFFGFALLYWPSLLKPKVTDSSRHAGT